MPAITWACCTPSPACSTRRGCPSPCPRSTPRGSRRRTCSTWSARTAESWTPSAARSCDKSWSMRLKRVVSANSNLDTIRPFRQQQGRFPSTLLRRGSAALLVLSLGLGCGGAAPKPAAETAAVDERIEEPPPQRKAPAGSPLVKEAEALLAKGDAAGAKTKFEAAIAEQPDDARAYLGLGLSEESLEQLAAAEKAYRKAIEIDPSLAEAHNNLGLLLRDKEDLDGAIASLTRATEADPRLASAQANLAMALEDAKRPSEADQAYARAVKL